MTYRWSQLPAVEPDAPHSANRKSRRVGRTLIEEPVVDEGDLRVFCRIDVIEIQPSQDTAKSAVVGSLKGEKTNAQADGRTEKPGKDLEPPTSSQTPAEDGGGEEKEKEAQVVKPLPPLSSPSSSRRQKKANRRKTRPTQGGWVLIREMAPNQPDIAHQVSQQALHTDSTSESESESEDMETRVSGTATALPVSNAIHPVQSGPQPFVINNNAKDVFSGQQTATSAHRDSVVEPDLK
jgi:hypothetical protein